MKSYADTFTDFYKIFGLEKDRVAPSFVEAENWLLGEGKGKTTDQWLQYWLVFAISTFLCPTSSTKLCVRAFHSVAKQDNTASYNWCQLVVDRLKKGIMEFKERNRKFVSGCLFFLTVLYLDSLDVGQLLDQNEQTRATVWTGTLMNKVCSMDRLSANDFGKLPLKQEYSSSNPIMLIPPSSVHDFVNSAMPGDSITLSKEALKDLWTNFSTAINQAVLNFTVNLCQGSIQQQGHHDASTSYGTTKTAGCAAGQPSTSHRLQRNKNKSATNVLSETSDAIDEDEFEEKSDTPPGSTEVDYDDETDDDTRGTREFRSKRRQDRPRVPIDKDKRNDGAQSSSEELEDYGEPEGSAHEDCSSREAEITGSQSGTNVVDKQVQSSNKEGQTKVSNIQQDSVEGTKEGNEGDGVATSGDNQVQINKDEGQGQAVDVEKTRQEDLMSTTPAIAPNRGCEDAQGNQGSASQIQNYSQASNASSDEYEDLTPPTNERLFAGMSLFEFMATPPKERARRGLSEQLVFEPPEIFEISRKPNLGNIISYLDEIEIGNMGDGVESTSGLSTPLKEAAKKFEAKLVQEETAALPIPKTMVKTSRIKISAQRTHIPLRKQLAKRVNPVGNVPPLAPKKIPENENKEKDADLANESNILDGVEENDARVVVYARKHNDSKADVVEKQLNKGQAVPGSKGKDGEGCSHAFDKKSDFSEDADKIKNSKGFKDAPDAPSFSLGFDDELSNSPNKSTGTASITESMFEQAYEQAMNKKGGDERRQQQVDKPDEELILEHIPRHEVDGLYMELHKYNRVDPENDTSPMLFKSNEVTETAGQIANGVLMGRSLNTITLHIGTYVLSQDPKQKRRLIMSPWVGLKIMSKEMLHSKMIQKSYEFIDTDYDTILCPIFEPNKNVPDGVGHWFTLAVNMEAKKFQIIDSLRAPDNKGLIEIANRARGKFITLWNRYA